MGIEPSLTIKDINIQKLNNSVLDRSMYLVVVAICYVLILTIFPYLYDDAHGIKPVYVCMYACASERASEHVSYLSLFAMMRLNTSIGIH